ncbi:MAG TPA: ATP-binding protein [Patescibacteria group bacterium]|nr:ATP-binding protein [Patescibacteria group bacterium]
MPIILLLPTRLNFIRFELDVCEGRIGPLWYYLYSFQFLSILMLIIMGAIKFKSEKKDLNFRKQVLILTVAISFFLLIFLISNLSGELLKDFGEIFVTYQINLVGPLGMVLFLALLTYLIVEYKVFNIKLITAQALIVSLIILVASLFSFNQSSYEKVIICVTLLLTMGIGWALVRSVKLEIQRKEQLQDMTDKLAVANEQLRKLDNAKSEFISIASHQLRTPLTAVKGYGSLLLEGSYGKMSEKQKDVLNKMYQSNERLITLVEDILNLSRIESGRMEYKFESVKIEEVLQEIFDTFILKAKERKLSLELVKSEKSLPEVKTDRNKIREIISNFTDNAIKYTPEGGVKMKAYEQDGKVVVAISDTGIGIPQEEIPYLFEKFSRGKNISRLNAGGTGLGLHVGIKMIQELKGRIRVESEGAGKGSTFFVELPTE